MTTLITATDGSPFDAIRRTRADGSEYWSARDLMPLMGYGADWRNFQTAIERARVAATNSGHDVETLFGGVTEKTQGRPREDFHLARMAAYLVSLNGDPRKPETAAAQAYFVIRTREAETTPAVRPEQITRADLAKMVLAAEEEKAILEAALESAAPAIEYHDRYVLTDDVLTVKAWGAQFGLTGPQAYQLLVAKNVVYRMSIGTRWSAKAGKPVEEFEYRARAGRPSFTWFDLRPQHNAPRHHNGQVRQTLYVRQAHALDLGRRCGLAPVGQQTALRTAIGTTK